MRDSGNQEWGWRGCDEGEGVSRAAQTQSHSSTVEIKDHVSP